MTRGKKTDASSILGAARRAQEVPRPQDMESQFHTSTPPQENRTVEVQPASPVQEKRVNVALRASTHKALKLLAVQRDMTVQDLVEEISQAYLTSRPS